MYILNFVYSSVLCFILWGARTYFCLQNLAQHVIDPGKYFGYVCLINFETGFSPLTL